MTSRVEVTWAYSSGEEEKNEVTETKCNPKQHGSDGKEWVCFFFHLKNKRSSSEATWELGIKEKEVVSSCRRSADLQNSLAKDIVVARDPINWKEDCISTQKSGYEISKSQQIKEIL